MHKCNIYHTPNKQGDSIEHLPDTALFTPHSQTNDGIVNYKAKTFKLMKQLAEAQVSNKKSYTHIRQLQKQLERCRQDVDNVCRHFGVSSIEQVMKINRNKQSGEKKQQIKVDEWTNIVEEYKKIINTQQYKYLKLEQQLKLTEMKLSKYEQERKNEPKQNYVSTQKLKILEEEFIRVKEVVIVKEGQVKSLTEQLDVIKQEYKQILVDREQWKDKYAEVQNKYNLEIEHFEDMERHVEERLMQVQRQMNYYKEERQNHLEKIQRMKQEIQYNQNRPYFSFGGVQHQESQTDYEEKGSPYDQQCLQISIKTLLEQNAKLKQILMALYKRKPDEQLPKDVQLQLKILFNMHGQESKYDRTQQKQKLPSVQENQFIQEEINKQQEATVFEQVKEVPEQLRQDDNTDKQTEQTDVMQHRD